MVSTIWKVTNLVGTEVVSMRCSCTTAAVVSTGLAVVVRRRGGLTVGGTVVVVVEEGAAAGAPEGLKVVRTTKCEFLWVVWASDGRRVVERTPGLAVLRYDWVTFLSSSLVED